MLCFSRDHSLARPDFLAHSVAFLKSDPLVFFSLLIVTLFAAPRIGVWGRREFHGRVRRCTFVLLLLFLLRCLLVLVFLLVVFVVFCLRVGGRVYKRTILQRLGGRRRRRTPSVGRCSGGRRQRLYSSEDGVHAGRVD